jgi:hypothetical protein
MVIYITLSYGMVCYVIDAEKQGAINLFLGNYIPYHGGPPLWELQSDHHLHNMDPRIRRPRHR